MTENPEQGGLLLPDEGAAMLEAAVAGDDEALKVATGAFFVTFKKDERLLGPHRCCTGWDAAMKEESDWESYEEAIRWDEEGGYELGPNTPRIAFCPFCGVEVK